MKKLTLILPVLNQEKIIKDAYIDIVKNLNKLKINFEIILVENGSTDNTWEVIKGFKNEFTIPIKCSKGYGNAVLSGIQIAKGEFISYMPSDGQIDSKIFSKLFNEKLFNNYQIVKVKRTSRESILRFIVMKTFSYILRLVFNTPLLDINGSPKILKSQNIKYLNLQSRDSFIDAELIIKSSNLGWKVIEIPMRNLNRLGGESTRTWRTFWEFFKNIYRFKKSIYAN